MRVEDQVQGARAAGGCVQRIPCSAALATISSLFSLKRWARICVIAVYCVACCLACSEIPETLNLSDDVSNDFVFFGPTRAVTQQDVGQRKTPFGEKARTAPATFLHCELDPLNRQVSPESDLLALYSVRRT
jgi:hypothetical protein